MGSECVLNAYWMGSVGMIEMNFIDVHTCKKNNFMLINKYDIILFQLLNS